MSALLLYYTMKLKTFSKLNLSLLIYRPRKDGYHPLCSVFQSITLYDSLTIKTTPEKTLLITSDDKTVPTDKTNIISKIYQVYKPTLKNGYSVHITKRIPMGGGLGGGSSNAAGFLYSLNSYENWNLSLSDLAKTGSHYGADIPFFFHGPTALVRGIGEKVKPLPMKSIQNFILINPKIHCSTAAIFNAFDQKKDQKMATKTPKKILSHYFGENDLLPIVCTLYPEINQFYTTLKKDYPTLSMSGSGSTFFIPCQKNDIPIILNTLTLKYPTYFIKAVTSSPYAIQEYS